VYEKTQNYEWVYARPHKPDRVRIYECHVGICTEQEKCSSYNDFIKKIPYIAETGYNVIQLMGIMGHSYYASFGYLVTNYFAVSSRFGPRSDFKRLVDTAHKYGLQVIIDLVHSHASADDVRGIARFDGTVHQYFHTKQHKTWTSMMFNYGIPEVQKFLLSNAAWFVKEYNVDGYRMDAVTTILYGDTLADCRNYEDYYTYANKDALMYLKMVNDVVKFTNPDSIMIAEEASGIPLLVYETQRGGIGFDYRLHMGSSDMWVNKVSNERSYTVGSMIHELTNVRNEEKVITYLECHDNSIVGSKPVIMWLLNDLLYTQMAWCQPNFTVDCGIDQLNIFRALTIMTAKGGYLTFMGNEFGHPEWLTFHSEVNNTYKYCRRQWNLLFRNTDTMTNLNTDLKYRLMYIFEKRLLCLDKDYGVLNKNIDDVVIDDNRMTVCIKRGDILGFFNLNCNDVEVSYSAHGAKNIKILLDNHDAVGRHGCLVQLNNNTVRVKLFRYSCVVCLVSYTTYYDGATVI
ncbi:1,4-alpha-glucan-branching protein, partial [Yasminevirus sp. GU-2018]